MELQKSKGIPGRTKMLSHWICWVVNLALRSCAKKNCTTNFRVDISVEKWKVFTLWTASQFFGTYASTRTENPRWSRPVRFSAIGIAKSWLERDWTGCFNFTMIYIYNILLPAKEKVQFMMVGMIYSCPLESGQQNQDPGRFVGGWTRCQGPWPQCQNDSYETRGWLSSQQHETGILQYSMVQ